MHSLDLSRIADAALVRGVDQLSHGFQFRHGLRGPNQPELFCTGYVIEEVPIGLQAFLGGKVRRAIIV